jgi:hypothetical protein
MFASTNLVIELGIILVVRIAGISDRVCCAEKTLAAVSI